MNKSAQIIATSHDLTPKGSLVGEIPLFQVFPGWWIIMIWPDKWWISHSQILAMTTLQLPHKKIPQKSTTKRVTGPSAPHNQRCFVRWAVHPCRDDDMCWMYLGHWKLGGETSFFYSETWGNDQGTSGRVGAPFTYVWAPWYLSSCSLGILGDNLPINTHEL